MNLQEIKKFDNMAHEWWDIDGKFKTLHHINPTRMQFIQSHTNLTNKKILDVGCGGGILTERLALNGGIVTGIDLAPQSINVAKMHLLESNLDIDYQCIDIVEFANHHTQSYDVITCMEILEHVDNPEYIISNCAKLLKPNGIIFLSTLDKTLKSYLFGVLIAEYILKLLPKGTHNYEKFIRPSDLRHMLSKYNLQMTDIKGLSYNPLTQIAKITNDINVNYMVCASLN